MKKILALCALALTLGAFPAQAEGPGIGIILGEPTGISLKTSLASKGAIDAAAAWSFEGDGFLHLHADYLFHNLNYGDEVVEQGTLGAYYGIGARAVFRDDDPRIGARIPLGLTYLVEDSPLEIFGELVPVLDIAPDTEFRLNGGIGIRYWLGR